MSKQFSDFSGKDLATTVKNVLCSIALSRTALQAPAFGVEGEAVGATLAKKRNAWRGVALTAPTGVTVKPQ